MGHSFDMLTFDFLLKPPQPITGLFFPSIVLSPRVTNYKNDIHKFSSSLSD